MEAILAAELCELDRLERLQTQGSHHLYSADCHHCDAGGHWRVGPNCKNGKGRYNKNANNDSMNVSTSGKLAMSRQMYRSAGSGVAYGIRVAHNVRVAWEQAASVVQWRVPRVGHVMERNTSAETAQLH